jgi:hypothetical protein
MVLFQSIIIGHNFGDATGELGENKPPAVSWGNDVARFRESQCRS